jgi:hypothetical protein
MKMQVTIYVHQVTLLGHLGSGEEVVEDSTHAHAVAIQKVPDFLGVYDEDDISLLVLEECLLYVENN